MSQKIGVISHKMPHTSLSLTLLPKDSSILWFDEIEAAFAYLLSDSLDKLYIDRVLLDDAHLYVSKYQKQMEQLHPHLEVSFNNFTQEASPPSFEGVRHYPKLDTLFKNGDLKSVFQPIIEARGNKYSIHGIECLSRFHYNGHFYAPEFIFNYAAEKLRLMNCDKICLMQALSLVPHNKKNLIFINVRPQTLISPDFCSWFKSLLKKNQLLPEQIVMEVTEQYCNISETEMSAQCKLLHSQGIRLAIDDFGSGISNLSMLEVMKPSYIKISGRFIKNAHQDSNKQKIIKNILDLAADFDITTIVESVEHEQEWSKVRSLGACLAQGFYFFKPMDAKEIMSLFKKGVRQTADLE